MVVSNLSSGGASIASSYAAALTAEGAVIVGPVAVVQNMSDAFYAATHEDPIGAVKAVSAALGALALTVAAVFILAEVEVLIAGGVSALVVAEYVGLAFTLITVALDKNIMPIFGKIVDAAIAAVRDQTAIDDLAVQLGVSPFPIDSIKTIGKYADYIGAIFYRVLTDPLVIDLTGEGVELTSISESNAYFDLHGTGYAAHTGWVGANTGILVCDVNGNGSVDGISELFGSSSVDGFSALAAIDVNHDGVIDRADPGFANLQIWTDSNGNGVADPGELHALDSLGITAISLSTQQIAQSINGNEISKIATFTRQDGSTGTIAEAFFDNRQLDSQFHGEYEINVSVALLPNLRGYGTLPDLYVAMSLDADLLQMVRAFSSRSIAEFANFSTNVTEILYRWAGVSNLDQASRGEFVRARDLAVLEAFTGETFSVGGAVNSPTNARQGAMLESAFQQLLLATELRLIVQGPLASFFPTVKFAYASDSLVGTADLSSFVVALGGGAPLEPRLAETYWRDLVPIIDALAESLDISRTAYEGPLEASFASSNLPFSLEEARLQNVFLGTSGSDMMVSSQAGPHYFDGAGGHDYVQTPGGGDRFIFNKGYGDLEIRVEDPGALLNSNVLILGEGIAICARSDWRR